MQRQKGKLRVMNKTLQYRILYFILFYCIFSHQSFGQEPKLKSTSWRDNWKLEVKTGTAAILTPVPDKYLERTNNVNVPLGTPGVIGIFSIKKSITPHLEMGYQLDYMRIKGMVDNDISKIKVLTQAFTHTYQIQYNIKSTEEYKPLYNYFLYYKIGGISLKNDPLDQLPHETEPGLSESRDKFVSNVAILTGIGAGINYQLNNNLSLTGTFDVNRSSDAIEELYKIHKLFYNSSHSVNNYIELSFGLSYWFSFGTQKKSLFYNSRNETDKQLIRTRIEKEKGKNSFSNKPTWYNNKKGK